MVVVPLMVEVPPSWSNVWEEATGQLFGRPLAYQEQSGPEGEGEGHPAEDEVWGVRMGRDCRLRHNWLGPVAPRASSFAYFAQSSHRCDSSGKKEHRALDTGFCLGHLGYNVSLHQTCVLDVNQERFRIASFTSCYLLLVQQHAERHALDQSDLLILVVFRWSGLISVSPRQFLSCNGFPVRPGYLEQHSIPAPVVSASVFYEPMPLMSDPTTGIFRCLLGSIA